MVPKESLAKAKARCPGNRLAVHLNALLREQLPSGVTAETHGSVEALGRARGGGYTLFLQRGVQKSWGGRRRGSETPWSLSRASKA